MTPSDYLQGYSDCMRFGEYGHGETEHSDAYWHGFCDACARLEHDAHEHAYAYSPDTLGDLTL